MKLIKVKFFAMLLHLLISIIIVGLFFSVVKYSWYPEIYYELENVWEGIRILVFVDFVLGPLLTFIIFAPRKKNLRFDLAAIASFQLIALLYGGHLVYQQRPAILVFAIDRFEVLKASDEVVQSLPNSYFGNQSFKYPVLSYALPPSSKKENSDNILNNIQFHKIANRHRPLDNYIEKLVEQSLEISFFTPKYPTSKSSLVEFVRKFSNKNYILLPIQGTTEEAKVIGIDRATLSVLGYIDIDPWTEFKK